MPQKIEPALADARGQMSSSSLQNCIATPTVSDRSSPLLLKPSQQPSSPADRESCSVQQGMAANLDRWRDEYTLRPSGSTVIHFRPMPDLMGKQSLLFQAMDQNSKSCHMQNEIQVIVNGHNLAAVSMQDLQVWTGPPLTVRNLFLHSSEGWNEMVVYQRHIDTKCQSEQLTMTFGSTAIVLAKCKLKYKRVSECSCW